MSTPQKQVLIVGGGVAGLAAARSLSQFGLATHVVEQRDRLGGHSGDWACMATDRCQNCGACLSLEMASDAAAWPVPPRIYYKSRLTALVPLGDGFRATISGPKGREVVVDGVILATGMTPFDPSTLESLQYGIHPRVITTVDLNQRLRTETLERLLDHQTDPAIAFVQCVGSRNRTLGNDYCSQVCCKVALRQAGKLKHLLPEARIDICHIDLQLMGKEVRSQFADLAPQIRLIQGVPGEVRADREGESLMVVREDPLSGERQACHYDLMVLAVGMRPADRIEKILAPLGVRFDEWGFIASQKTLPPRIQVAGAAGFPTDINGARQQGINAAMGLVAEMGGLPAAPPQTAVAVLGGGEEGRQVARSVQAAGYQTLLIEEGPAEEESVDSYTIYNEARLAGISGSVGQFELQIDQPQGPRVLKAAAIVVATGVQRQAPQAPTAVVSLSELEQTLVADWEQVPERVVFWLDHSGPEHKSNCRRALESAVDLTASGRQVCLIMEKMLVHGPGGQRLYDRARRQGVRFLRATDASRVKIRPGAQGLQIEVPEASLAGMPVTLACDLVVASDPVAPAPGTDRLSRLIGEPLDREGYAQWANARQRPIDSRRRGIYFVGGCHEEQDTIGLDLDIESLLARLALQLHSDTATAESVCIDPRRCRRCLTCLRTCAHGAVTLSSAFQPEIQDAACLGCGRCAAQCPAGAIDPGREAIPPETTPRAQTVIYACARSAHLAATQARAQGQLPDESEAQVIRVPCARSSLAYADLMRPLIEGAQRVVVAGCHTGNCRTAADRQGTPAMVADQARLLGLTDNEISWQAVAANEAARMQGLWPAAATDAKDQRHD